MAPRCCLSPSLLFHLKRRWIFLQHSVSKGTLLFPRSAELFTGLKEPESSFCNAELTTSGLLHGSPLPDGITLRLLSDLPCPSQSGLKGLSSFLLGKTECNVHHLITTTCFHALCLCQWRPPYLRNLSLLCCLENSHSSHKDQHKHHLLTAASLTPQDRINLSVPTAACTMSKIGL